MKDRDVVHFGRTFLVGRSWSEVRRGEKGEDPVTLALTALTWVLG